LESPADMYLRCDATGFWRAYSYDELKARFALSFVGVKVANTECAGTIEL